jgi:hypothetical protein
VDCGNGTCVMNETSSNGVYCRCDQGYYGDRCNHKIDFCRDSCVHGKCQGDGHTCVCDKGYTGKDTQRIQRVLDE